MDIYQNHEECIRDGSSSKYTDEYARNNDFRSINYFTVTYSIHYSGNNIVFPIKDAFFNIVSTTSTTSTRNNEYRFIVSNSF